MGRAGGLALYPRTCALTKCEHSVEMCSGPSCWLWISNALLRWPLARSSVWPWGPSSALKSSDLRWWYLRREARGVRRRRCAVRPRRVGIAHV